VRLLGRTPFTRYRVAVRCPHGAPSVLENEARDLKGRPFPTRYWLTCRALSAAVSRLEAAGGVRALEGDEQMRGAIAAAHSAHGGRHDGYRVGGVGQEGRVKCLHAQLAFALATGGNPVGDWILARLDMPASERCCVDVTQEPDV
jgi:hypothetical protein